MTLLEQIGIGVVLGLVVGFILGYFSWLFARWRQKKKAPKIIQKQNLKFKEFEHDNLNEVLNKNVKTQEIKRIESTNSQDPREDRTRERPRFGKAFT